MKMSAEAVRAPRCCEDPAPITARRVSRKAPRTLRGFRSAPGAPLSASPADRGPAARGALARGKVGTHCCVAAAPFFAPGGVGGGG
jgi:hypothetical protein